MEKIRSGKRTSRNGYELQVFYYQVKRCQNCPLRNLCHKAEGNRIIQVNHRLNQLKEKARNLLMSEKGLEQRSKRPIEVEAVFGQLKYNHKFNRFTFKGLEKVEMEFLLMALGHNFRKMVAKTTNKLKNNVNSKKSSFCGIFYHQKTPQRKKLFAASKKSTKKKKYSK
ncbi:transposase [Bernardetia sp. MNP-M8]|uniref:transposase n=1 Tax=Bernardetia sp. MNP-M8 TaxID=3127470 RepID=UPI0030D520C5